MAPRRNCGQILFMVDFAFYLLAAGFAGTAALSSGLAFVTAFPPPGHCR
jgi:hypothetical protein